MTHFYGTLAEWWPVLSPLEEYAEEAREILRLIVERRPGAHVPGDMRTLDLGRTFDVVLAHDAIDYITSEDDLARVFDVAWRHLCPGGIVVLVPDTVAEAFEPGESVSGGEAPDGRAARLMEWVEAAAPGASQVAVHYAFLLRDADGRVHSLYERHEAGLFPEAAWTRLLAARGFEVEVVLEATADDRAPRRLFVGYKPAAESRAANSEDAHDAHR